MLSRAYFHNFHENIFHLCQPVTSAFFSLHRGLMRNCPLLPKDVSDKITSYWRIFAHNKCYQLHRNIMHLMPILTKFSLHDIGGIISFMFWLQEARTFVQSHRLSYHIILFSDVGFRPGCELRILWPPLTSQRSDHYVFGFMPVN